MTKDEALVLQALKELRSIAGDARRGGLHLTYQISKDAIVAFERMTSDGQLTFDTLAQESAIGAELEE